ncbi:hypothetical protein CTP10_R48730 [Cupriavidus sp. P-10]|uniref:hypothetical protein n=1 Tax=Cupriavidus sp. P-10 TaxID=2027911 RepID=UPI0011C1A4F3|nr:hypothetical protein [Cupriavidus sp. P-10]BDB27465.1 hypothetical protein CTP10_R48730 [Cupriavidus sp. P-10]
MSLEIGTAILTALSLILTWLIFGKSLDGTGKGRFLYWLKSTAITSGVLLAWLLYKEPSLGYWMAIAIAVLISAVVNLVRSQWVFLIP